MPRTAPLLAAVFVLLANAVAQATPEIVVMMRDHAGRDSDLDARPLDGAELELLERVAGINLEPVRLEANGAQVLVPSGPIDPDSLRSILADLRAVPDVLYADPLPPRTSPRTARAAEHEALIESIVIKPTSRLLRENADEGLALDEATERLLRAAASVDLAHERAGSGGVFILRLPQPMAFSEAQRIAERLESDPAVAYAEPIGNVRPQLVPNDAFYPFQWHYFEPLGGANLPPAWDITTGSRGVVVGVLDSGILFGHPDLVGRLLGGFDFISDASRANDGGGWDGDPADPGDWVPAGFCGIGSPAEGSSWHGTHVAGTIGAASFNGQGVAGVNWVSQLLPIRVLGRCGGSYADIADAIRWAAGLSVPGTPNNLFPARVINMSLGGFSPACPQILQNAITDAVATGSTVVVSAGNDADNALFYSPANCAGVITVHANTWFGGYAPYSNYGMPPIDISAPGGDDSYVYAGPLGTHPYDAVLSLVGAGATVATGYEYYYKAGTSMAAPHVSGVASLLLSVNDELTPGQVEMILELSAWPFPFAPSSQCNTSRCGAGILDAATALAATPEREGLHFYPITPCRIVDTRGGLGPIPANDYRTFYGDGLCGVPLGAKAIATIITVANSTGAGYLQIWPPDRPFPATSAINFAVGVNRANNAFIRLSSVGSFSVYRSPGVGATHFIVDVNGYFQ